MAPAPKMKILMLLADCITVVGRFGATRRRENPELHSLKNLGTLTQ